jgi:hypothetical protein
MRNLHHHRYHDWSAALTWVEEIVLTLNVGPNSKPQPFVIRLTMTNGNAVTQYEQ